MLILSSNSSLTCHSQTQNTQARWETISNFLTLSYPSHITMKYGFPILSCHSSSMCAMRPQTNACSTNTQHSVSLNKIGFSMLKIPLKMISLINGLRKLPKNSPNLKKMSWRHCTLTRILTTPKWEPDTCTSTTLTTTLAALHSLLLTVSLCKTSQPQLMIGWTCSSQFGRKPMVVFTTNEQTITSVIFDEKNKNHYFNWRYVKAINYVKLIYLNNFNKKLI